MMGDLTVDFYDFDELKIIKITYVIIICKQHLRCAK